MKGSLWPVNNINYLPSSLLNLFFSFFFFQVLHCLLVVLVGTYWYKPCWGFGGKVCGSVCHHPGGTEHNLGPMETSGRYESLAGKQQDISRLTGADIVSDYRRFDRPFPHVSWHQVDIAKHFLARAFALILLPLILYVTIFAVHFVVLNKRWEWVFNKYTYVDIHRIMWVITMSFSCQWTRRWFLQFGLSVSSNWEQPTQCIYAWVWVANRALNKTKCHYSCVYLNATQKVEKEVKEK